MNRRELLAGFAGAFAVGSPDLGQSPPASAGEFMFEPGLVYLNTAALGPTPRSVLDRTLQAWRQLETNPVMMSYGDGAVHNATDVARAQLGTLINCSADEVLFTRSATAAMNSLSLGLNMARGDRVLTTDVEHEGGTNGFFYLKNRLGIEVDLVSIPPTDYDVAGIVRRFEQAITPATRVLFVSHVISATGLRMPVRELVALAKRHGMLSIIDGAQAVGSIDVDVKALGCDAYIGTGHKWIMGPKGTGFAYISQAAAARIEPVERVQGLRFNSGSTGVGSLPLAIGLGAAAEAMKKRGMASVETRVVALRDRAYRALMRIPQITIFSPPPGPLSSALVAFKIPDAVDSRDLRDRLLRKHKVVMKMAEKRWFNGNRLSPHIFNTEAEVDRAVAAIRKELAIPS